MRQFRTGAWVTVLATATALGPSSVFAQDDAPGLLGTLSFSQRFAYSDNPSFVVNPTDSSLISTTNLGFSLDSVTRTEVFSLSLGTVLKGDLSGGDDLSFERDTARLRYTREGATAEFSLGASYTDTDLDDREVDIDFDEEDLIVDGGSLTSFGATASLDTGIGTPFSLSLDAAYRKREYVGTSDPDLIDSERFRADALARFRLTPSLNARLSTGYSRRTSGDAVGTERTTRYLGLGLGGETAGGLSFSADITYDIAKTTTNAPTSTERDGVGFNLSVTQARPGGSIGASLSSRVDDSGRLTRANISRSVELKGASLSFSLGLIDSDAIDLRPVASLNYALETKRGELSATLTQTPTTDDGDRVVNTALRVNYSQAINSVSGWSTSLSYSEANTLGGGDISRASASVSYNRDLTEDWGLRAGYTHSRRDETGEPNRSENEVFLSLERDFSFGF